MILKGGIVRMSSGMKERVAQLVEQDCACGGLECQLTRRRINGAVTVHLQCLTCGRSLGGAMPRREFTFWQDYPEWDGSLSERYYASEERAARVAAVQQEKREQYQEWRDQSPDWLNLRARVLHRAGFVCEACLDRPAVMVHHLTYVHGRLPPAWQLRAVCALCHERLHAGWHD